MPKTSEAQRKSVKKYNDANTKLLQIRLNLKTDKDILDWLAQISNKAGYVKELIRVDIPRQKRKRGKYDKEL